MSQDPLKAEDITTVKQIILGESVPESMGRTADITDTCLLAVASDDLLYSAPG